MMALFARETDLVAGLDAMFDAERAKLRETPQKTGRRKEQIKH
jgi:hypothetical protein